MRAVNVAIHSGAKTALLRSLQSEDTRFTDVEPQNIQWYANVLSKAISDKAESEVRMGCIVAVVIMILTSFIPRLLCPWKKEGKKESLIHTDCACSQ